MDHTGDTRALYYKSSMFSDIHYLNVGLIGGKKIELSLCLIEAPLDTINNSYNTIYIDQLVYIRSNTND